MAETETETGGGGGGAVVSVHETRFEAAVKVIQSLPKNGSFQPTNEMMLKFYSFYKQATQGPCNIPRPGFWDPIGRYKWDAWSALGDMPKEEAMISYVEEMKKILESMPVTDKVEELLHVLGPFYEIVEDKKSRGSDIISGPVNVITPVSAVNGKSESGDSGAESEEEAAVEEIIQLKEIEKEEKTVEQDLAIANVLLDSAVPNGCDDDDDDNLPGADLPNGLQTKSALNGISTAEEVKESEACLELPIKINLVASHQGLNEDVTEELSGIQHLTSDSDSEIYCDSMEQFGQEEILESARESSRHPFHFTAVDYSSLLESPDFLQLGNYEAEGIKEATVEGKGEVKCGGEDGKADGGPHKEKKSEKVDFYGVRRGRGHRMPPVGDGSQGGQMGSGGDGERRGSDRRPGSSLNEQIAVVLIRLQEDMQNVFQRLHTLETLTASRARTATQHSNNQSASPVKRRA